MKLTILDTLTGKKKTLKSQFSASWWATGNGSCDCSRAFEMGIKEEMDIQQHKDYPELKECQGLCFGCERFLIINTDSHKYTLDEFNSNYPTELKEKYLWKY